MSMPAIADRWTLDELHRLPDDGNKYELVDGALFVTPPPTETHENVLSRLNAILTPFVNTHQLGGVFHPRAIIRFNGSQAEPDLFVRAVREHGANWEKAPAPLLVVEVLSPATEQRDLTEKRRFYLAAGAQQYWVIDADERTLRVIRPQQQDQLVRDVWMWSPTGASAVQRIAVADLFDLHSETE